MNFLQRRGIIFVSLREAQSFTVGSRPPFILFPERIFCRMLMNKPNVTEKVKQIAERIAEEKALELVQVELIGADRGLTVRIFIDKEGGVSHEDCAKVSREVGDILELEEIIPTEYILEVSSPGLERELFKLKDFVRYAGSLAKIKTRQPINGQRNFRGRILAVEGEEIVFDDRTNGTVKVPFEAVKEAKLEIDIEEELRKHGNKAEK